MKNIIIGIVTGFANGLFGSRGGTIVVPCMEKFLDIDGHKAHATAIAIILPLSVVSIFIYTNKVDIDWAKLALVSVGGVAGGFVGARLLSKISGKWLHRIFGFFMLVAAVKMIL